VGEEEVRLGELVPDQRGGLGGHLAGVLHPVAAEVVTEVIEALIEAELALENPEADDGRGHPAAVAERLGQGARRAVENLCVVAHPCSNGSREVNRLAWLGPVIAMWA